MAEMSKDSVVREIAYHKRYLESIADNVQKRKEMIDCYRRIAEQRHTVSYWSPESDVNIKDLRRKILKITKKQMRDFAIIRQEISEGIVRAVKMLALNQQMVL